MLIDLNPFGELKSTGVVSQDIAGIPADSASAVQTDNETVPEQGNNSSATESYIDWHVDGDVLKIEGSGDMPNIEFEQVNGVITIPKPPWNDYADHVTRIEIGEGITSVGDYAFMQFKKVRSVQLPSSLTRIGIEPFYMCWLLSDIAIPPSVTSIGEYAFYDCNLSGIEIPSGVTSIGEKTFYNNPKMEYVELPAALKTIGEDAFHFCFALKEVVIPDGTTSIDRFAFQDCTSLERVTIPASVTEINEYAFAGCNSLTDIYYGGSAEMWDKLLEKDFMPTVNVTVHYNAQ